MDKVAINGDPTEPRWSAVDNRRAGLDGPGREIEAERSQTGAGVTNDDRAGKTVLSALKQLQQDYSMRLREWDAALGQLQAMFGTTQRENARLSAQVSSSSQQVDRLSVQLSRLSRS